MNFPELRPCFVEGLSLRGPELNLRFISKTHVETQKHREIAILMCLRI